MARHGAYGGGRAVVPEQGTLARAAGGFGGERRGPGRAADRAGRHRGGSRGPARGRLVSAANRSRVRSRGRRNGRDRIDVERNREGRCERAATAPGPRVERAVTRGIG